MLVNFCMKCHEDILNGFQVTERTPFCDGQTDRWTDDPDKNNMSPNPKVGRHNLMMITIVRDALVLTNTFNN